MATRRHTRRSNDDDADPIDNDFADSRGMNALVMTSQAAAPRSRAQINLFKDGGLWQAAVEGDLPTLQRCACEPYPGGGRRGSNERGAEGETILHVAVLFKHPDNAMVKWILKEFPELVNEVYLGKRYYGETALHVAVVNAGRIPALDKDGKPDVNGKTVDDLSVIKLLVEAGAKVNGPLTTGNEFFQDDDMGCLYYGQTILQFAAANQKDDIVKYLVELNKDAADLTAVDIYGNNVLHVMMYHGKFNLSLFKYLKDRNARDRQKNPESNIPDITKTRNKQNFTCFQVGISRGHVITLEAMKEIVWEFGMVRQYKVLLDDLDPLQAHKVVDGKLVRNSPSAIDIAVQNGDKEMLSHPLMVAILKIKWALYARKSFMFGFAVAFLLMLFFTTAIALQPSSLEQRRSYTFSDPYSIARFVFEVLTIVSTIVVVRGEINEIRVQKAKYLTGHGASENLRQWVLSILIWVVPILRWGVAAAAPNSSETIRDTENVIMGIASIWGWISLLEFAQGFEGTGPLVLIFTRMVFGDFLSWMSLYTVLTVGFAAALFLQMQNVPYLTTENFAPSYDWDQIAGAILWTSRFIFMQAIFDDFRSSRIPAFTELLYIIYGFVVLILLLNVLIAMLAETLKAIASDSERHWRVQFAELLLKTDEALSPRHREFFLRHLGWFDKPAPKEKGDSEDAKSAPSTSGTIEELTESRYFVFTERDVLKLDPATEKKVKTVQTLKFVVARGHGNRPIEIDSNKSHWDSWFADLARIVSDGEEMQTSWWRNHHMRVQHEVAESKYKIIAKQMRLDALRKMGVANPEWEE